MYLFNAKIENPEKLEQMLVGREQIVDLLVNAQLQHIKGGLPPQYLVVGPRGSGKTHMLRVIYDRLSKFEEYMAGHEIAYMVEDETGIGSYFDLLQRIFEALKRWSNDETKTRFIVEQVENLKEMHSRDWTKTSENILLSLLKDRSLLVLIENFDTIMRGMDKKDEVIELAKLRDFIQQHQQVSFIATSQSLIHALSNDRNPFYGFFHVINLKRLSLEESFEFVRKIALSEHDGDLVEFLESHEGKGHLEAIHQFTKGNHRLLLVFFDFLRAEFRSNLSDVFLKSIDELKPYYDSFIKSLAPQQQKIVQYLSLQRVPQKGADIGRNCFLDKSTVSKQLSELQRLGYINPVNEKGRDKYYEITEPLLRMCFEINEDRNGIIKLFVNFLGQLYASEQLKEKYLQYHYLGRFQPEQVRDQYQAEAGIYKMVKSQYLKDWNLSREDEERLTSCCEPEEAKGLIDELSHPKMDILLSYTIEEYIEQKKWSELIGFLQEQIMKKPDDDYLLFYLGLANGELEQYEKAIEAFQKSTKIKPDNIAAWYNLGNTYDEIGDYPKAVEAYQKAIELQPDNDAAWNNLGLSYSKNGDYPKAVEAYQKAIELQPDNDAAWYNLGNTYAEIKDYPKAVEAYQKAIELKPDDDAVWYNLGNTYFKIGDFPKAVEAYQKAIKILPQKVEAWYNLGNTYNEIKDYPKAVEAYQKAIEIKPDKDAAWNNLGITYFEMGDYPKAVETYQKAIELQPDNDAAWYNLGSTYDEIGDYPKAIEAYQKAIEIKPDDDAAWYNLGNTYDEITDYPKAVEAYQKAIEIKPDYHEASYILGITYYQMGDYPKAIEAYQKAIEIKPDYEAAWNNLGNTYDEIGDYPKAVEAYLKAIEIKPDDNAAWNNLGITHFKQNNYFEAKSAFNNALKYVNFSDVKKVIEAYSNLLEVNIALKNFREAKILIGKMFISREHLDYISELKDSIVLLIRENNETEIKEICGRLFKLCMDNNKVDKLSALFTSVVFELLKNPVVIKPHRWEMLKQVFEELFAGKPEFIYPLRYLDIGIRYYVKDEKEAIYELSREEREVFEKFTSPSP